MSRSAYTVSSLNRYVKQVINNDMMLNSILVKGEVSNFTNHRSGHWYFTLKDAKAKISCIMFASYASKSKILLKEGMQVIVNCSLSVYEAQGNCQLIVTAVQIDGVGDLFVQLEQLKETLRTEGLFEENHKKILPLYPMSIGIVTAKTGAAVQDMLTTIARRWPIADVKVYPTLVQGEKASKHIIQALTKADANMHDVILLARGGGAIEDLWCFNTEELARFVYHMNSVVVSGVGHETDTTLIDYVSDARAPTPTAAAELITPDITQVKRYVEDIKAQLCMDIEYLLNESKRTLKGCKEHRYMKDPQSYCMSSRMKLAMHIKELEIIQTRQGQQVHHLKQLSNRLVKSADKICRQEQESSTQLKDRMMHALDEISQGNKREIQKQAGLLDAFSPLKILQRGYSITYQNDEIIHSVKKLKKDGRIRVRLYDGSIDTIIDEIKEL